MFLFLSLQPPEERPVISLVFENRLAVIASDDDVAQRPFTFHAWWSRRGFLLQVGEITLCRLVTRYARPPKFPADY